MVLGLGAYVSLRKMHASPAIFLLVLALGCGELLCTNGSLPAPEIAGSSFSGRGPSWRSVQATWTLPKAGLPLVGLWARTAKARGYGAGVESKRSIFSGAMRPDVTSAGSLGRTMSKFTGARTLRLM